MTDIKWIFFDIGSTLVDESIVYERRFKTISELANVSKEYVFQKAIEFYKNNKKSNINIMNWNFLYKDFN